ncbi:histidine kinase [Lucifera butyrica]|uniref:Oxygen sensor histidine kinase NreB n=1 Tax=Lucifera butyrica TaxID=1351585 RepID=A0A498RIM9_9FIRM|nr:sensor histidine kinase [Lucifera butyrica]VBB09902.1 histidine kinase [Lucifera butyrica]
MKNFDVKMLDTIVKQTMEAVEKGKNQIFDIYEAARQEMENVKRDVERVKQETINIIFQVDELEKKERRARLRLMEVSRNFRVYSEEDIKEAYEEASQIQMQLAVARQQEITLRRQRDDLEIRLRSLKNTVDKAEGLVSHVGAVLGYLGNQMGSVVTQIESLQQKQVFGSRIIRAQEEERRRVAREIHDGPAQAMANIVFRSEVCERLIDTDMERAKREIKDLQEQVRSCLKEVRKIIFDLRPMALDDLGLVPTVRRILDTIKEQAGMFTDFKVLGHEKRLDSYLEIGLFRIIQEALSNVVKHAKATLVSVRIEFRHNVILVIVEDNGQGFDTGREEKNGEHFGLMGISERIEGLNGEISIKSEPGKGTIIFVKVPLQ